MQKETVLFVMKLYFQSFLEVIYSSTSINYVDAKTQGSNWQKQSYIQMFPWKYLLESFWAT